MIIGASHSTLDQIASKALGERAPVFRSAVACGIGPERMDWGSSYLFLNPNESSSSSTVTTISLHAAQPMTQITTTTVLNASLSLAAVIHLHAQLAKPIELEPEFIRSLNIATSQAGRKTPSKRRF